MPGKEPNGIPDWTDPTREEIYSVATAVLDGDWRPMLPETVLDIEWVDDAWDAEETDHATLHSFWRNACRTASSGRLTVDRIDPSAFKGVLRHVMLLDVEEDGYDARYRVYGSGIVDKAGRDWTGFSVAEMNRTVKAPQALFYRACYLAVFHRKEPMFTHHLSAPWIASKAWKRLIVPVFGNNDAVVRRFLVVNVPVQGRAMLGTEWMAARRKIADQSGEST